MKRILLLFAVLTIAAAATAQTNACYDLFLKRGIEELNAGHKEAAKAKWNSAFKCKPDLTAEQEQTLNRWIRKADQEASTAAPAHPKKEPIIHHKKAQADQDEPAATPDMPTLPEMVFVQGGSFQMGSNNGINDEKPVHTVTVDNFYIGKYEITQKQWESVMGANPSQFKGDNLPVENVNWDDIQEFIQKLNQKTGKNYRLPTEAEWEFAARGGNKSSGYTYSGSNNLDDVAWNDDNSDKTHPVGKKRGNELGLYDMSGNVREWCGDWFGADYYTNSPSQNPVGPGSGSYRVIRGGGWLSYTQRCRSSHRGYGDPTYRFDDLGFRVASRRQ